MSRLFLFNPENDLALAFGGKNYTPPPLARAIASDLSTLPFWYADTDDVVWLSHQHAIDSVLPYYNRFGITPKVAVAGNFPIDVTSCIPWGWSFDAAYRFLRAGVAPHLLPSDERLTALRRWGHRISTRYILSFLQSRGCAIEIQLPMAFDNEGDVSAFVQRHSAAILKSPWSGSGKGLCWTYGDYDIVTARWTQGVLRRQGEVVAEISYRKEQDFAMEFYSDGNSVSFAGYSCFSTDERGAYKGNLLTSDAEIEKRLSSYISTCELRQVCELLIEYFSIHVAPLYTGFFGVDMMVYITDDGYRLHPCIEVNLRMNMGMVAHEIYRRFVAEGVDGVYRVEYFPDNIVLMHDHQRRMALNPAHISGGKISAGYFSLCPITDGTHYRASIEIIS